MIDKVDYSVWLTKDRLTIEDNLWSNAQYHADFGAQVRAQYPVDRLARVLEFGCGPGWLIPHLGEVEYHGVDANVQCIELAKSRYLDQQFSVGDIRTWSAESEWDIVCAVATTKHFALHEWSAIVKRILSFAPVAVFSQPIGLVNFDTGVEFPHVFVKETTCLAAIADAGHTLILVACISGNEIEPIITTAKL